MVGTLVRGCKCAGSWCDLNLTFDLAVVTLSLKILSGLYLVNSCKDFNQYFQDKFLARGTTRVMMMLFCKFLVTAVAMAILFLYFFQIVILLR